MRKWIFIFVGLAIFVGFTISGAEEMQIGSIIPDIFLIDSGKEIVFRIDPNGNIYGMNYRFIGKLTDKEKKAIERVLYQYAEFGKKVEEMKLKK